MLPSEPPPVKDNCEAPHTLPQSESFFIYAYLSISFGSKTMHNIKHEICLWKRGNVNDGF